MENGEKVEVVVVERMWRMMKRLKKEKKRQSGRWEGGWLSVCKECGEKRYIPRVEKS